MHRSSLSLLARHFYSSQIIFRHLLFKNKLLRVHAQQDLGFKSCEFVLQGSSRSITLAENLYEAEKSPETQMTKEEFSNIKEPLGLTMDEMILGAKDVQKLLTISMSNSLVLKHFCLILSEIGKLNISPQGISIESLVEDQRFLRLCTIIERGNYSQSPTTLYIAIKGLKDLKFPPNGQLCSTLNNEIKWSIGRCSLKSLAKLLEFLILDIGHPEKNFLKAGKLVSQMTFGENEVYPLALEGIHKRWVEVSTGTELISIFKIISIFEEEVRSKLENRAVEFVHELTSMEILKLFIVLGEQKRRPTPLLRSMAFHLSKSEVKIPTKEKIELIYALNDLTFADPVLMTSLCDDLASEISSIENSALISTLVTSLGQMRYKHKELCRVLEEWILKRIESNVLRPFDFAAWLLTSAVLNLGSDGGLFENAAASTLFSAQPKNLIEWVNLVHALAVLNQLSPELLSSVLNKSFVQSLDSGDGSVSAKVKLLQLNAFAKNTKGYKGPTLDKEHVKKMTIHVKENDEKLSRLLIDTLASFIPAKHLESKIKTDQGIFMDALVRLNEKGEPSNGPKDEKVSLMIQGFQSTCLGSKEPTGQRVFQERILQSKGFTPIFVPYTEFNFQMNLLNRVKYLEKKLKSGRRRTESSNHD